MMLWLAKSNMVLQHPGIKLNAQNLLPKTHLKILRPTWSWVQTDKGSYEVCTGRNFSRILNHSCCPGAYNHRDGLKPESVRVILKFSWMCSALETIDPNAGTQSPVRSDETAMGMYKISAPVFLPSA